MKKLLFVLIIYSNCLFATWKAFIGNGEKPCFYSIMGASHVYALVSAYQGYKKTDKTKSKLCYGAFAAASIISMGFIGLAIYSDIKK